jgi:hypothetical protein
MPLVLKDRVKETTTTAGTGTVTLLGAVTDYQTFAAIGNGNTTYYCIAGQGSNEWEVGIGTYTSSGTTLSRDTVLASSAGGTTKVTFSAGTKDVFCTYPAGKSVNYNETDQVAVSAGSAGAPIIAPTGDLNTGIFFPAADTVAIATAGTEDLRVDSAGNVGIGLTPVASNGILQLNSYAAIKELIETATITASAPSATTNFDVITQAVQYYTSNATTNFTLNIRGNSGTSLNTIMQTGQSVTLTLLVTNGTTAYYVSAYQVDGSSVTPRWLGGGAPTAGNPSSIDAYTFTVIKTASATFTVLASQTRFA